MGIGGLDGDIGGCDPHQEDDDLGDIVADMVANSAAPPPAPVVVEDLGIPLHVVPDIPRPPAPLPPLAGVQCRFYFTVLATQQ